MGYQTTFISFGESKANLAQTELFNLCAEYILVDKEVQNLSVGANWFSRLSCLLRNKPFSLERFHSQAMTDRIASELARTNYALILCDGMYALRNVPQTDVPILLNCHNVENVLYRRYSDLESNPLKKAYATREGALMELAEVQSLARSMNAIACSPIDQAHLQTLSPSCRISVVPNIVDTDFFTAATSPSPTSAPKLLFQGGMDWYPNRDAVQYFVRDIFPKVRQRIPQARFVAAGRNPPTKFVRSFAESDNIQFTGTVPDMRPYLQEADVVVVPLRIGAGTRIKILEACASGKVVVSTSVGAEGLDLRDRCEILIADDPGTFATRVVEAIQDHNMRESMARQAREAAVERYSQPVLNHHLQNAIYELRV
jgi:polysaccharide biosynthesis protein PslH